jgi:hypothetical protein
LDAPDQGAREGGDRVVGLGLCEINLTKITPYAGLRRIYTGEHLSMLFVPVICHCQDHLKVFHVTGSAKHRSVELHLFKPHRNGDVVLVGGDRVPYENLLLRCLGE